MTMVGVTKTSVASAASGVVDSLSTHVKDLADGGMEPTKAIKVFFIALVGAIGVALWTKRIFLTAFLVAVLSMAIVVFSLGAAVYLACVLAVWGASKWKEGR